MVKIIILTGNETRHQFFRKAIANDPQINVLKSFCEGTEKSLEKNIYDDINSSVLQKNHVSARTQSENDFFGLTISHLNDKSNPEFIEKGEINNEKIVENIINLKPDLLICYGSSLIKSKLIELFKGSFLNVHLGLSPYYRGSGTNIWPIINKEPEMIGATFMQLDKGIDTGLIIHQIRADIFLGDSPHSIGNRLIRKMTFIYKEIILNFNNLKKMEQPIAKNSKFYKIKDFDAKACKILYENISNGIIEKYINNKKDPNNFHHIVINPALKI